MNDHFQDNIYKCLLFRHVRVTELSKRVSREVDCTLYGMFNVKKKRKKTQAKTPFTPSCSLLLSYAVQRCLTDNLTHFNGISVPPTTSVSVQLKSESIVY